MEDNVAFVDRYLITLRIIQPARVQDVLEAYLELWNVDSENAGVVKKAIYKLHDKMRQDGLLIDVRKGTFILSEKGMEVTGGLVKEREIDNRRLFLMKRQRRLYH